MNEGEIVMANLNEFNDSIEINESDVSDLDSILPESQEPTTTEEKPSDDGVIDLSSIDDVEDEYVPTNVASPDATRLDSLISEKLSYIASKDTGHFAEERKRILNEVTEYKKDLIINRGFTPEEAEKAAMHRAENIATETATTYATEHPEIAVIKVNKTDSDKLDIAEEDKAKVRKSSVIRLVEVEDKELAHLTIKKATDYSPINIAQLNTCVLAKQSVPCINTGDVLTFTGTSSYNLVSLFFEEDDTNYQRLSKQIAICYEKFVSSTTKTKFTSTGEVAMTQEDFANWLTYPDLAAALYAIYVASSTEMLTSPFECPNCKDPDKDHPGKMIKHPYNFTYNCKELIDYSEISDDYKRILDGIRQREGDRDAMLAFSEENNKGHRYKSPITKNIYDIQVPSCARALAFTAFIDDSSRLSETYANIGMYIHTAYIYSGEENGTPVYTEVTDYKTIYDIVANAIEPEFQFYYKKLIDNKAYIYSFKLTHKCDKCGHETSGPIDVASLIFHKAQGMEAEIE